MTRRRRDSIGISWHPRGYKSNLDYDGGDRYDILLQDVNQRASKETDPLTEYKKQQNELDNEILKKIVKMNYLEIWQEKGQSRTCKCGSKTLCFSDRVAIKYRKGGKINELTMQGKICNDCGRKYVVRKILLEKYHEAEG